jgi:hypothetical protein
MDSCTIINIPFLTEIGSGLQKLIVCGLNNRYAESKVISQAYI